jgi:hypothetical protein
MAAERERRIAAPIENKQRLLAALERGLHRLGKTRRNETPRGGPSRRRSIASMRQMCAAEALRQMQPPIAAAPRVHLGFDRGVADASTIGILATFARTTAMSRA